LPSYKQEVGGSSPSPPIQPKGLQSWQLGTELEFRRRLPSGVLGCTRGASESEEADRGVSKRGGCGRAGHVHPAVTRTPLWATYAALQALVADYLAEAEKLDEIPMLASPVDRYLEHLP
jgi:hypothetical protein